MTTKTYDEVLEMIRGIVEKTGSQKAAADQLKISQQYVGDILAGKRFISDKLAHRLGYRRVIFFEKLFPADISERKAKAGTK